MRIYSVVWGLGLVLKSRMTPITSCLLEIYGVYTVYQGHAVPLRSWVAVKEFSLTYHNMGKIVNDRVSLTRIVA